MAMLEKSIAIDRHNVRAAIFDGDICNMGRLQNKRFATWEKSGATKVIATRGLGGAAPDGWLSQTRRPQEGLNLLKSYLAEAPSIDLLEVVFKASLELESVTEANQIVSAELRRTPTLLGLDNYWMRA